MRALLVGLLTGLAIVAAAAAAAAGTVTIAPRAVTEYKAVYGRVEARYTVSARARIGGTLEQLSVTEGDQVSAGQRIATVRDEKISYRIDALDAEIRALRAQLANAESELARGQALVERGVVTAQRLDALRTDADVVRNRIAAAEADRQVIVQQGTEGAVLAPSDGRVVTVPATEGAVILPGEAVATIGSGGTFLRLAIPERHAPLLERGASLAIEAGPHPVTGTLAKIYPEIVDGRVLADVEIADIPSGFLGARVLVRVPIGTRSAIVVPQAAVIGRSGLDFVRVRSGSGEVERTVVLGERLGGEVEVLTGLAAGDEIVTP